MRDAWSRCCPGQWSSPRYGTRCSALKTLHTAAAADHADDLHGIAVADHGGGVVLGADYLTVVGDGDAREGDLQMLDQVGERQLGVELTWPAVHRHTDHAGAPVPAAIDASTARRSAWAAAHGSGA